MPTWLWVVIALVVLVLLVLLVLGGRRARERQVEQKRVEADRLRREAEQRHRQAEEREAVAAQEAERARRQRAEAERREAAAQEEAKRARRQRKEADDALSRAADVDPDIRITAADDGEEDREEGIGSRLRRRRGDEER